MPEEIEVALRSELANIQHVAQITITDQASYTTATNLLTNVILPFRKSWKKYWDEIKRPIREALTVVQDKFNEGDELAERAEKTVKSAILKWQQEQERILQEAQRKAQEEAEAKERADREAEAFFMAQSGASEEQLQSIITAPSVAVAEPVEPSYIRDRAVSTRENWKCEVTDLKALCKAIGAGKVPPNYVVPNEPILNARAKADKSTMAIPGCRAVNIPIVAGRTRS